VQVDATGTRLFFREGKTGYLDVRVVYAKGELSAVSYQLSAISQNKDLSNRVDND
jgi:hypothetical protein